MVEVVFDGGNWSGCKVYENGVDISGDCQDITISPGRSATVKRFAVNEQGKHYVQYLDGNKEGLCIVMDKPLSVDMINGTWIRKQTITKKMGGRLYKKTIGYGAESPWLVNGRI